MGVKSFLGELMADFRLLEIVCGDAKSVGCCKSIGEDNGVLFPVRDLVLLSV